MTKISTKQPTFSSKKAQAPTKSWNRKTVNNASVCVVKREARSGGNNRLETILSIERKYKENAFISSRHSYDWPELGPKSRKSKDPTKKKSS